MPVWTATLPNLQTPNPSVVHVTASGTSSHFCGMHKRWGPVGSAVKVAVNCFTNGGAPVNSGFLVSYSSR